MPKKDGKEISQEEIVSIKKQMAKVLQELVGKKSPKSYSPTPINSESQTPTGSEAPTPTPLSAQNQPATESSLHDIMTEALKGVEERRRRKKVEENLSKLQKESQKFGYVIIRYQDPEKLNEDRVELFTKQKLEQLTQIEIDGLPYDFTITSKQEIISDLEKTCNQIEEKLLKIDEDLINARQKNGNQDLIEKLESRSSELTSLILKIEEFFKKINTAEKINKLHDLKKKAEELGVVSIRYKMPERENDELEVLTPEEVEEEIKIETTSTNEELEADKQRLPDDFRIVDLQDTLLQLQTIANTSRSKSEIRAAQNFITKIQDNQIDLLQPQLTDEEMARRAAKEAEYAPILEKITSQIAATRKDLEKLKAHVPVEGVTPEQEANHERRIERATQYIRDLEAEIATIQEKIQPTASRDGAAAPIPPMPSYEPPPPPQKKSKETRVLEKLQELDMGHFESIEDASELYGTDFILEIAAGLNAIPKSSPPTRKSTSDRLTKRDQELLDFRETPAGQGISHKEAEYKELTEEEQMAIAIELSLESNTPTPTTPTFKSPIITDEEMEANIATALEEASQLATKSITEDDNELLYESDPESSSSEGESVSGGESSEEEDRDRKLETITEESEQEIDLTTTQPPATTSSPRSAQPLEEEQERGVDLD